MVSEKMKHELGRPSAIRAMFEKGGELKKIHGADNVFDFSLGNPNLPPPAQVDEEIIRIIKEERPGMHGYMQNAGYEDVRERVADKLNKSGKTKFGKDGIVITSGAAAGLNIIFKSILDPCDEVIVIAPFFVEYKAYVENFGGQTVVVNSVPDTFLFDPAQIEGALTERTKALILNSPNNPTGAVYPEALLKSLSGVLERFGAKTGREVYVVSDEPYRELVYDGITVPIMSDIFKNAVTVYSFSKSLSLAGERIGYIAVPPSANDYNLLVDALILSNRILGFVNAPALFQQVVARCLYSEVDVLSYKKKRDVLYEHITKLGFECFLPQGAFYLFPRSPIADDTVFCNDYAMKYNILAAPGAGFGLSGFFRLAYCVSDKTLELSMPAFEKLAKECF